MKYHIIHTRWLDRKTIKIEETILEKKDSSEHLSVTLKTAGIEQDSILFVIRGGESVATIDWIRP